MRSSMPSELPSLVVPNGRQSRAALLHQPLAVRDEPLRVRAAVLAERRQHRGDDAGEIAFACACASPRYKVCRCLADQAGIGMPGCLTGTS